jgi:hypothetical protein
MAFLEEEQAKKLFMCHAFKHANSVTNDFEKVSMEIIKSCGGLPLSLEILGCYLCDIPDLEIRNEALRELKGGRDVTGGSDNEMLNTFRRAYWNADDSSSPMLRLRNLKDRSLINWAEDGILYMHEQLRNMGRNIATQVTRSRFIWKPNISFQNNQV